jgi:ABC-type microcin C transport system permease subunit YejE
MLILIIAVAEWPQYARTVRASVLAEKKEYVDAARVIGLGPLRIICRRILPNTLSLILVVSTVQVANAIVSEAALSFLGLGMPVNRPSLGSLVDSGFELILSGVRWITLIPGIVGESGASKSVAAFSILNLVGKPGYIAGGEVLFEGMDLTILSPVQMRAIRGNRISMIFKTP